MSGMAVWGLFTGKVMAFGDRTDIHAKFWVTFQEDPGFFLIYFCVYVICGVMFLRMAFRDD